jgi:hypothetical protein
MAQDRSSESTGPDPGSPGGMGGVRARGGTGTDRPPGGVSPIQAEEDAPQNAQGEESGGSAGPTEQGEDESHPS